MRQIIQPDRIKILSTLREHGQLKAMDISKHTGLSIMHINNILEISPRYFRKANLYGIAESKRTEWAVVEELR